MIKRYPGETDQDIVRNTLHLKLLLEREREKTKRFKFGVVTISLALLAGFMFFIAKLKPANEPRPDTAPVPVATPMPEQKVIPSSAPGKIKREPVHKGKAYFVKADWESRIKSPPPTEIFRG